MHTTPIKYITKQYFQTKKYKKKLAIKFKKYLFLFSKNNFSKTGKLYYYPSSLSINSPQIININKIIIGIPNIFQQKQEILLSKNYPLNFYLSFSLS